MASNETKAYKLSISPSIQLSKWISDKLNVGGLENIKSIWKVVNTVRKTATCEHTTTHAQDVPYGCDTCDSIIINYIANLFESGKRRLNND